MPQNLTKTQEKEERSNKPPLFRLFLALFIFFLMAFVYYAFFMEPEPEYYCLHSKAANYSYCTSNYTKYAEQVKLLSGKGNIITEEST